MTDRAVVIVGAGPTGMMLAAELALAGVDAEVVERSAVPDLDRARAGGLHSRTIELLDQRGVADRFLEAGQPMQIQGFAGIGLDIGDFPTRFNYGLALAQAHSERLLAAWVDELGVPVTRPLEMTGFAQDESGVDVELSDRRSMRAEYLVGCDGGRSVIRKSAGIDFPGWEATTSWVSAEVQMEDVPKFGVLPQGGGVGPAAGGGVALALIEGQVEHTTPPTLQDVREALHRRLWDGP
ncbi:MAG: FAD-dependent monooxygenase, partial [Acidimicrobiales bacterium]